MAEYVGSPEILWMILWGITASTSSRETFVVSVMSPVRCIMPFVFLVEPVTSVLRTLLILCVLVVQFSYSPVTVVDLLVGYVRFSSSPVTVLKLLDKV